MNANNASWLMGTCSRRCRIMSSIPDPRFRKDQNKHDKSVDSGKEETVIDLSID
jgi:hypothetical protein